MTSIVSILMTVVMIFSSFGGMTAGVEETASFEAKISVDADMLAMLIPAQPAAESTGEETEEAAQPGIAEILPEILNVLTIQGVAAPGVSELDLFAGKDVLLSLGMKTTEEGAVLASSLLGRNVIQVSPEMIAQAQQQMMSGMAQSSTAGMDPQALMDTMQNLDWEQISKDFTEVLGQFAAGFEAKTGETEKGEFTVDGFTFSAKTPVNITYEEAAELLLTTAKELLGRESVRPLVEAFGAEADPAAQIDEALENLKNLPEDQKYTLELASYAQDDVTAYYAADLSRGTGADGSAAAEQIHAGIGTVDGQFRTIISGADGTAVDVAVAVSEESTAAQISFSAAGTTGSVTISSTEGGSDVLSTVQSQGMAVTTHVVTAQAGDRTNFTAEVMLFGAEKPLVTITGSAGKGGEVVSAFEGEEITAIPFESLASTEDTTASSQLTSTLMLGLMNAINVLKANLPESIGSWLNTMLTQMMAPAGSTSR